eukprot:gene13192-14479_t
MSAPNDDLNSALKKLGITFNHPRFQSLPANGGDPLWERFEKKFNLDEFELGALKNARCVISSVVLQGAASGAVSRGPEKIDDPASCLSKRDRLTFIVLPICDYYGRNVFIKTIINEASQFHFTPFLNFYPRSQVSYCSPTDSESQVSDPNLLDVINIITHAVNKYNPGEESFSLICGEDVSRFTGDYHFCSG